MDYILDDKDDSFINYYKDSTLCMYGRLQIILKLTQSKIGKYGYVYDIQPQTVSFMKEEIFTEKINNKNISMIISELRSIQDSLFSFRYKKNKLNMIHQRLNKEIYHIQRYITKTINTYTNYLNVSRTEET